LAYWLSNASTLLLLLQRTLKASGAAGMAPQRRRSSSATLFGRMTQVSIASDSTNYFPMQNFYPSGKHSSLFPEFPWNSSWSKSFPSQRQRKQRSRYTKTS